MDVAAEIPTAEVIAACKTMLRSVRKERLYARRRYLKDRLRQAYITWFICCKIPRRPTAYDVVEEYHHDCLLFARDNIETMLGWREYRLCQSILYLARKTTNVTMWVDSKTAMEINL